jgi:hypothetical protein
MTGWLLTVSFILLTSPLARAQTFISGSTGADGPFNPTSTTTVPLPPNGVLNYTTITVPAGVTATFLKTAANTPVVLLATGNVTISGTLSVSGSAGGTLGRPGSGGLGGFDGGPGGDGVTTVSAGAGLGPGGGLPGTNCVGNGGSYGTTGGVAGQNCTTPGAAAPTYGQPTLRPIIGGSGGSGGTASTVPGSAGGSGGGGGGALVVASSGTITLNSASQILADGGSGSAGNGGNALGGGGGSGGAIRLIANTIVSNGSLYARGGTGAQLGAGAGGLGRIRLEASTLTVSGTRTPEATQGLPQPVFPAGGQPGLAIASIGGVAAPTTPSGSLIAAPDILLPVGSTSPVEVILTASNIPLGTAIQVTATPQSGAKSTATSGGLTGTLASSTATAPSLALILSQTSILTATATFPLVASAGEGPLYADGEEVTHIRVAAVLGGGSRLTYITRSGREVIVQ